MLNGDVKMNFYDENAQEFFNGTVNADISHNYEKFVELLPENAYILDVGCGSGRETKVFMDLGFNVFAFDWSVEMCKLASKHTGIDVKHMLVQDIDFEDEFDGIWAYASLLHVPSDEMESVLLKLKKALKSNGIFCASFKHGEFEGQREGRYYTDLTEEVAAELFEKVGFKVLKTWLSDDVRKERSDLKWTNIIVKKE